MNRHALGLLLPLILSTTIGVSRPASTPAAELDAVVDQWPEFRGPRGDGWATGGALPIRFSESDHLRWKTAIPGRGWSSPVIWDQQIWLTTATEDGTQMSALALDRSSGKVLQEVLVFANLTPAFCHPTNSYASPTPVIEAGRVYVHFGSYGTACLDTATGQKLWERRDLPCDHFRGPGASPILFEDKLFFALDGFDRQYVVALDKHTGATVWQMDRNIRYETEDGDIKKAYSTGHVIEYAGRKQFISPSAAETIAYDPQTGAELWRVRHGGMNAATRPLFANGLVYVTNGDSVGGVKPSLVAIRPDGQGAVTESHVAWTMDQTAPKRPSPLAVNDLLFTINDDGIAMCLEGTTGATVWRKRIAGTYRASPLYADGKIYFASLEGDVTVIEAGREYQELAVNHLDNGFQASPAAVGNSLILRSTHHVYCLE